MATQQQSVSTDQYNAVPTVICIFVLKFSLADRPVNLTYPGKFGFALIFFVLL